MTPEPRLDPPGAGLPAHEAFVSRHVLMPLLSRVTSWHRAAWRFRAAGDTILARVRPLDEGTLRERVLIPRFLGIEDSSRYWSPAMTVRHLVLAGEGMRRIMADLRAGRPSELEARIEAVKPELDAGPEALEAFAAFMDAFEEDNAAPPGPEGRRFTHPHPWFGPLDLHQWHVLAALHHGIHLRQIERILARRR